MSGMSFRTKASGKWVLTGEHAVLRGATAIALPHPEFGLELFYRADPSAEKLNVQPTSASQVIHEILSALQNERKISDFQFPLGHLEIQSTIPIGAGLGSSAALCVAMGRWLSEPLGLGPENLLEFATRLEHRFHGRSSGMDVAVIASGEPISFAVPNSASGKSGVTPLGIRSLPRFTFHDTGLRTRTSECVAQVEKLQKEDPSLARQIDEQMNAASRLALEGLLRYNASASDEALDLISRAIKQAQECFSGWQLVPDEAKRIQDGLIAQGALATKITGAGGGGMIVALWAD